MFNFILSLIDKLPTIRANLKTVLYTALLSMAVGFGGYPLYLLYRSDQAVIDYLLRMQSDQVETEYTNAQLQEISTILRRLQEELGAGRVAFGLLRYRNRIYLRDIHNPYIDPLPLGFQTIWMGAPGYEGILGGLKAGVCSTTEKPLDNSYLRPEMELSDASYLVICPSNLNWFIAAYLPSEPEPSAEPIIQQAVRDIEKALTKIQ